MKINKIILEEITEMRNRLPLPLNTIKEIKNVIEQNKNNLWIKNPLENILRDIADYDYSDAIKGLKYLQSEYPELMDYNKHIKLIKKAEERYDTI